MLQPHAIPSAPGMRGCAQEPVHYSQVLINGGPLAVRAPRGGALVEAFYGGQAAGEGLAAALYGEVNPSGRMPVTTYATAAQAGDIRSYDMTEGLGRTYRYLSAWAEPLYPFGFGLSYTRWRYGELRASPTASVASSSAARGVPGKGASCLYGEDDAVVLRLNLTNAGEVDGAEVAQLYVGFSSTFEPRTDISAHVPLRQLADFKKLFLRAGCNPREWRLQP
jgi:beta-glucosidase